MNQIPCLHDVYLFHLQIRTRAISAKAMTLVSPLQLLLFGSKKVVSDGSLIILDDWYGLLAEHGSEMHEWVLGRYSSWLLGCIN